VCAPALCWVSYKNIAALVLAKYLSVKCEIVKGVITPCLCDAFV
jgi:hypothetical protein